MAGPSPSTTEDIRKMGHLIKVKTNKRKYFVLRDETKTSAARLEYYDSEKKWRSGTLPKRTIILRNCFNINSKPDAKHKYAIALYTKDDCFAIACQSEEEQQDWLTNMMELRNRDSDDSTIMRPLFEHIWPVTVKSKGLGGSERKVIPGQYRLCLTNKDLSLIPLNNDQVDIILPLDCIRRCGHTNQFFFLELGRSAKTGQGNLWLQVEDMVIAQNIHEALLSSMKNSEVPTSSVIRIRSGSSASATDKGRKRSSVTVPTGGGSSSIHSQPKRSHSIYNPSPSQHRENAAVRVSVIEGRPLHVTGPKPTLDDMTVLTPSISFGSAPTSSQTLLSSSLTDGPIEEEPAKLDEYMTITPTSENQSDGCGTSMKRISDVTMVGFESVNATKSPTRGTDGGVQTTKLPKLAVASSSSWSERREGDDYVPMTTPTEDRYMFMSVRPGDEAHHASQEEHGSNSSVSSAMSSVGSMSIAESSEHSFHSLSQLQEISMADCGYIEMTSPENLMEHSALGCIRPDVVPCYVRDEGTEDFPKRAYSVGSKPVLVPNKPLNSSYIDMSGRAKAKKEAEKSSSAPHLNEDEEKRKKYRLRLCVDTLLCVHG